MRVWSLGMSICVYLLLHHEYDTEEIGGEGCSCKMKTWLELCTPEQCYHEIPICTSFGYLKNDLLVYGHFIREVNGTI